MMVAPAPVLTIGVRSRSDSRFAIAQQPIVEVAVSVTLACQAGSLPYFPQVAKRICAQFPGRSAGV